MLECCSLDSVSIGDSLAICEFLAESHPESALWPRDRQLRALARSAAAQIHSGFSAVRGSFPANFIARYTGNVPISDAARKEIERLLAIWDEARKATKHRLESLGEDDGGFLFGKFSIADAFYWPVLWVCSSLPIFIRPYELTSLQRFRSYGLPLETATPDALAWMATMWNDPVFRDLGKAYHQQAQDPETCIDKYDDIFRDRHDVQYDQFPEAWEFSVPGK